MSTVKSTRLYVRRFFTAGFAGSWAAMGADDAAVSAPEQSSSMPLPGMSIAPGLIVRIVVVAVAAAEEAAKPS